MAGGYSIDDIESFERAAGTFTAASQQARGTSLESSIASGAAGIEGTKTAAALKHLGASLARDVGTFATDVETIAQKSRDTGNDYREVDERIAAEMRRLAR